MFNFAYIGCIDCIKKLNEKYKIPLDIHDCSGFGIDNYLAYKHARSLPYLEQIGYKFPIREVAVSHDTLNTDSDNDGEQDRLFMTNFDHVNFYHDGDIGPNINRDQKTGKVSICFDDDSYQSTWVSPNGVKHTYNDCVANASVINNLYRMHGHTTRREREASLYCPVTTEGQYDLDTIIDMMLQENYKKNGHTNTGNKLLFENMHNLEGTTVNYDIDNKRYFISTKHVAGIYLLLREPKYNYCMHPYGGYLARCAMKYKDSCNMVEKFREYYKPILAQLGMKSSNYEKYINNYYTVGFVREDISGGRKYVYDYAIGQYEGDDYYTMSNEEYSFKEEQMEIMENMPGYRNKIGNK
jgi:hypothetical protein